MTAVIGIDPSLSGFAVAVADGSGVASVEEWRSNPEGKCVWARSNRYHRLVAGVTSLVSGIQTGRVLVEGYSMGSRGAAVTGMIELGWTLRWELLRLHGITVLEIAPATLKKWASGKGNASKSAVVSALTRRYGREFDSDNEADAFALAEMGRQLEGLAEPQTKAQREALQKVEG
jgi:crossover junction endodeoxyribonuclease RuvC